jgi:hypothetical protein
MGHRSHRRREERGAFPQGRDHHGDGGRGGERGEWRRASRADDREDDYERSGQRDFREEGRRPADRYAGESEWYNRRFDPPERESFDRSGGAGWRDPFGDEERYGGYYRGYGGRERGPDPGFRDRQAGFRGESSSGRGAARSGPHSGRGPVNYRRSDERIREDVSDRLCEDGALDATNITVTVNDGEVTLEGTVEDRQSKRDAEDLAYDVAGITQVHNRLRVESGQPGREGRSLAGGRQPPS